jgi:hypothetical protein
VKAILGLCLIGCSFVLTACQTVNPARDSALCTLRPIAVSEEVRTALRAPLLSAEPLPDGYGVFLRDIAAHNAKLAALCDQSKGL